jgi:uncharacterized membrane protein
MSLRLDHGNWRVQLYVDIACHSRVAMLIYFMIWNVITNETHEHI